MKGLLIAVPASLAIWAGIVWASVDIRFPVNDIKTYTKLTSISFVDQPTVIDNGKKINVDGHASWSRYACKIVLKKSMGASCLQHELKHCIHEWKHDKPNSEFCTSE